VLGISLALGAALIWGLADFVGGLQSRRHALLAVLGISQVAAVVPLVIAVLIADDPAPSGTAIAWSMLAAGAGGVGIAAFYRGLAVGTMSIVAPISATGSIVAVLVGLADGERPGAIQVAGIVLALAGVALASREPSEGEAARHARVALGLAVVAALGLGGAFVGLERATADAGVPWAMLTARGAQLVLLLGAAAVVRPVLPRGRVAIGALLGLGLIDVTANALFAIATTEGLLSIVSVLAALYPAVTVMLARTMLHERVSRTQEAGVLVIFAGVLAISAG
jgi:drug/metabolite transporter (DMT)-like permease